MDQESSVAKGIGVPEAFEQEQEDDNEEEPLGATMNKIFTEIEKMSKTRPNSLLIEVLAIFLRNRWFDKTTQLISHACSPIT